MSNVILTRLLMTMSKFILPKLLMTLSKLLQALFCKAEGNGGKQRAEGEI